MQTLQRRLRARTQPAQVLLTANEERESVALAADFRLMLPKDFLRQLAVGSRIVFRDARRARRSLTVVEKFADAFLAEISKTAYVTPETEFKIAHLKTKWKANPLAIAPLEQFISLKKGDFLMLTKSPLPGNPGFREENGEIREPARIPCTLPEVFNDAKVGEKIWFDAGIIGGVIKAVSENEMLVEITSAGGGGAQKLRADKGINLPDSDLRFPSLTPKDLEDLRFIVQYADAIGYSFVRTASDVEKLQKKLRELGGEHLGIILKIETRCAFEHLPAILLTALHSPSVGVMIARGDLAVETGFERLAEVQEEILWMCEAAHLPVIWATQVLENLSKNGVYSRAEITDAAMSERAECVMLNKGAFVVEAVRTLDNILTRMQSHQDKKRPMLRRLHLADMFFEGSQKSD